MRVLRSCGKNLARLEGDINAKEMQRAQTLEELAAQDVEIDQIKRSITDSEQSLKKQDVTFFKISVFFLRSTEQTEKLKSLQYRGKSL
eukprot:UN02580